MGEQEAGPLAILVTTSSTTQVTTADVLPCKGTAHPWCVQALVRAIVATGDAKIILRSDNEPAILDLKRQAAAECRVRHGMAVIIDVTTEYESQDNGLAEMAVREVKGVARSVRVALSELYKKDISSKAPSVALARLLRCRPDHARTDRSRWVDTASKTERENISEAASCPCRVRPLSLHWQESFCLPERWSDGLFPRVVEKSSAFEVGTVLFVVRCRNPRRRPLETRANVEFLDKLVGVPWQQVLGDLDSSAVPTVISAEPIAEGDDLPGRADAIPSAARTYLRKKHRAETTRPHWWMPWMRCGAREHGCQASRGCTPCRHRRGDDW